MYILYIEAHNLFIYELSFLEEFLLKFPILQLQAKNKTYLTNS